MKSKIENLEPTIQRRQRRPGQGKRQSRVRPRRLSSSSARTSQEQLTLTGEYVDLGTGEVIQAPKWGPPSPIPVFVSQDEIVDYLNEHVDKRRLRLFDGANNIFRDEHTYNTKSTYTYPQHKIMKKLINAIIYRNIVTGTKNDIAEILGVATRNLNRTLNVVGNLIRISQHSRKGEIKILVSPIYGFLYPGSELSRVREVAIMDWYFDQETDMPGRTDGLNDLAEANKGATKVMGDSWFRKFLGDIRQKNDAGEYEWTL